MPEKYLLCLEEKADGNSVNIHVEGVIPKQGEDLRVIPTHGAQRYYKITRVLHGILEESVKEGMGQKMCDAQVPQVYARRYDPSSK